MGLLNAVRCGRGSTDGGTEPVWSADGRELFYRHGDEFFVVEVLEVEPEVVLGEPRFRASTGVRKLVRHGGEKGPLA